MASSKKPGAKKKIIKVVDLAVKDGDKSVELVVEKKTDGTIHVVKETVWKPDIEWLRKSYRKLGWEVSELDGIVFKSPGEYDEFVAKVKKALSK